jgi:hypothetical protein
VSAALANVAGVHQLLRRLVMGDGDAIAAIAAAADTSDDPLVLVAAALIAPAEGDALLARAAAAATTTRDRQLVAIAAAHRRGERDRVDALAREHLVDHPDDVLVAWIAGAANDQNPTKDDR